MAFWQNYKGCQNESSSLLLSHQVKICSMATMTMLANMVLGPQSVALLLRTLVLGCTGTELVTFSWSHAPFSKGRQKMVVTHVTCDREAALHLWDHQLYGPEVGFSSTWSLEDGFMPDGCLWSSSPTASFDYIWAVPSYKGIFFFLSFLSWQVP